MIPLFHRIVVLDRSEHGTCVVISVMTNSAHRLNCPRSVSRKEGEKVYSVLDLLGKSLRRGIFNPINGRDANGVPRRSTDFKSDSSESAFAEFTIRNFESVSDHMLSFQHLFVWHWS
jgi:hypothetical protein